MNSVAIPQQQPLRRFTNPWDIPADVARKILKARDALLREDLPAAFHELYSIADPGFCNLDAWAALECVSSSPKISGAVRS